MFQNIVGFYGPNPFMGYGDVSITNSGEIDVWADGGSASVTVNITGSQDVATLTSATEALTESDAVLSTGGTRLPLRPVNNATPLYLSVFAC